MQGSGVLTTAEKSIPFRANLNGIEKEFELKAKTVALLLNALEDVQSQIVD